MSSSSKRHTLLKLESISTEDLEKELRDQLKVKVSQPNRIKRNRIRTLKKTLQVRAKAAKFLLGQDEHDNSQTY